MRHKRRRHLAARAKCCSPAQRPVSRSSGKFVSPAQRKCRDEHVIGEMTGAACGCDALDCEFTAACAANQLKGKLLRSKGGWGLLPPLPRRSVRSVRGHASLWQFEHGSLYRNG